MLPSQPPPPVTETRPSAVAGGTARAAPAARLAARAVTVGYPGKVVSEELTVEIPDGRVTMIIGPNACGKSTLLRTLARLVRPSGGQVVLDGADLRTYRAAALARRLGLLPQSSTAPEGITVAELVARGRFPHQGFLRQWSADDEEAVTEAMVLTGVDDLAARPVDTLSGGQRQRVWVAMLLAQRAPLVLLDEPTTYLDLAHQVEVLDLCRALNTERGTTVVAVLHDLNQACRYGDHLVVMKDGAVVAQGPPAQVVSAALVEDVFGLPCLVVDDPESGTPLVIPRLRARSLPAPVTRAKS